MSNQSHIQPRLLTFANASRNGPGASTLHQLRVFPQSIGFHIDGRDEVGARRQSVQTVVPDRVRIQRLIVRTGFRESLQVVPNDQIAIQVTPGDLEVVIEGKKTAGRIEPGTTFYVPKNAPHQFLNMGKAPYDVVVVMLK